MQLVECATKHTCFIAELFEPRPDANAMVVYRDNMVALQAAVEEIASRERCPFAQLGIYIDEQGACLLATAKVEMQLCHARSGLSTLLQPLDTYETGARVTSRKRMEKSIRPLDALDKVRLDAWSTVGQLRPRFPKAPRPERPTLIHTNRKDFVAAWKNESDSEDDGPQMLAIQDGMVEPPRPAAAMSSGELALYREGYEYAFSKWRQNVQHSAVVVMLSVGALTDLTYIACHREERRVQFIVAMLKQLPDLAETCTLVAKLAQEGLLPQSSTVRARKAEFLKRCQAALAIKNPLAELDVKKLPRQDQRTVALALEPGKKICSRCPNPADTALEFGINWFAPNGSACSCPFHEPICRCQVPEVDPRVEWYCAKCAIGRRAAVCPSCKTSDALVQDGEMLQTILPMLQMGQNGFHQFANVRCTRCSRLAIAPFTSADKRKYNDTLAGLRSRKRLRW